MVRQQFHIEDDTINRLEKIYEFQNEETVIADNFEAELSAYLIDSRKSVNVLLTNYPTIRAVFIHYNTVLPSSAPVERIFNFANMILRPQRRLIGDSLFEQLLILKTSNRREVHRPRFNK